MDSVGREALSGLGGKIIAPVCLQRIRLTAADFIPATVLARRRKYPETVSFSRFAKDRIKRASSSLTLKLIVFIL
jgi:hypothetical protein